MNSLQFVNRPIADPPTYPHPALVFHQISATSRLSTLPSVIYKASVKSRCHEENTSPICVETLNLTRQHMLAFQCVVPIGLHLVTV